MKKTLTILLFVFTVTASFAQVTAQDFTKTDCDGLSHHLFAELDSGYCVFMEFAMMPSCQPCIIAGKKVEKMKLTVNAQHPGQMKWYLMEFSGSSNCASMTNWKNTNGITSTALPQGNTEVDYYGGMGMPTLVLLGGADHKVLWRKVGGFVSADTTVIKQKIDDFFAVSAAHEAAQSVKFAVSPNPAQDILTVSLEGQNNIKLIHSIMVYNAAGALITTQAWQPQDRNTVNVATQPKGLYVLTLHNEQGQTIGRQQFIKE